jgi:hypothetical protein
MPNTVYFECFFHLENQPSVGSPVAIEIAIPKGILPADPGVLQCLGQVIGVEREKEQGKLGVTCRIDSYQMAPSSEATKGRKDATDESTS